MNLLTCILIAIPIGIIFIMLWIYNDYRKYKKKNKLAILLFLLFPTTLSAQYVDAGCQVSFKWLENQKGKLEYTKDGVTYKFIPNDSQWEIIIRNNSSEDIRINWENMQFIVDGRTSEVKYPILAEAETPFAIIKSQAETSQKIGVTTYTANKANSRIYNKKEIRKGRNSSITIILPISIGKHPQFFFRLYHQKSELTMTSQDIKKQLKEPHFWNIVLTGQHAEPRTKAMLEAKGIITWLPLAPVRRQWGRILKEIHTPVIPRCVFVYISNEERNTLQKSYRLLQPEIILQELPDLCNQNK